MSLLELIVSASLMFMVLTVLYQLLIPAIHVWHDSNVKADAQRQGLTVAEEIAHELRLSALDTVSIQAGTYANPQTGASLESDTLSCLSPIANGAVQFNRDKAELTWQQFLFYYLNPADNTVRVQIQPIPPAEAPSPRHMVSFNPSPNDRILAHNVWSLGFRATSYLNNVVPPALNGAITISLDIRLEDYDYHQETSVTPLHRL